MKTYLPIAIALLFFSVNGYSNCSDCNDLKEAYKNPLQVTHLNLSNRGISQLSDSLNLFVNLTRLDVSNNPLVEIPSSLLLGSVEELILDGTFVNPWKMEALGNSFPNTRVLSMKNCRLVFIGNGLGTFRQLEELDISNNLIESFPNDFRNLLILKKINASNNLISFNIAALGYLWNIESIDVRNNPKLKPFDVFNALEYHSGLKSLAISAENWDNRADKVIGNLPLQTLVLADAKGLPKGIINLSKLETLHLVHSEIDNKLADPLVNLKSLKTLVIENMALPAVTQKLMQLEKLALINPITTASSLFELKSLKQLDILQTNFSLNDISELNKKLPETEIIANYQPASPAMLANTVAPIVEQKIQTFAIPGNVASILTADKVRFDVPPNAFLDATGKPYTEEVKMDITVYNDPYVMALSGAPMMIDIDGKPELFASNGMLEVNATKSNGEELFVNPAAKIKVTMPNLQPGTNPSFFSYDDKKNNWNSDSSTQIIPKYVDSVLIKKIDSISKLDLKNFYPSFGIENLYAVDYVRKNADPSEIFFRTTTSEYFPTEKVKNQFYGLSYNEGKLIASQRWYIDTVVSTNFDATITQLKQLYALDKRQFSKSFNYTTEPRIFWELKIEPNFELDNYSLQFKFKDSLISLPVYLKVDNVNKEQEANKKFVQNLEKARNKDALLKPGTNASQDKKLNEIAAKMRDNAIKELQNQLSRNKFESSNYLTYEIAKFGLLNCDFYARNPTEKFTQLATILVDQNGQKYESPDFVRNVVVDDFTYLESDNKNIPVFKEKKNVVLILLTATKIGVVSLVSGFTGVIKQIRSIDITGKSASEVANLIRE